MPPLGRREFIRIASAAGGGVLVSVGLPGCTPDGTEVPAEAWISLRDNEVVLTIPTTDMGQGTLTSLAAVLAEELELDWETVRTELAPAAEVYRVPGAVQKTAASNTIRHRFDQFRRIGAGLRDLLVAHAAERWGVSTDSCRASGGRVEHPASGRVIGYGELFPALAGASLPEHPRLKLPADFRLIGTSLARLDTPGKIRGQLRYAGDLRRPAMVYATLVRSPNFEHSKPDPNPVAALPEGVSLLALGEAVAVVGPTTWSVLRTAAALDPPRGATGDLAQQEGIERQLAEALDAPLKWVTNGPQPSSPSEQWIEADYLTPFQAHAALEPLNCLIDLTPKSCQLWIGTQEQTRCHDLVTRLTGLRRDRVTIHTSYVGGSFGRHQDLDLVAPAVEIAKRVGRPVSLVLGRTDDLRHGFYRAMAMGRLRARLAPDGLPEAVEIRVVAPSTFRRLYPEVLQRARYDRTMVFGLNELAYRIPSLSLGYADLELGVPVGWMRGVTEVANAFFIESFLDEVAHATGRDGLALRLELTRDSPRHHRVLTLAAERAGYRLPAGDGRAFGVSLWSTGGSPAATVVEVEGTRTGTKVRRIVVAVDCGLVVNPDGVRSQIEGGALFGLSGALHERITIQGGGVAESNFHDYRLLRMGETPPVEVHIVPSTEPPTGVGETGTVGVAPALTNAIASLTGRRIRRLPLTDLRPLPRIS